MDDWMVEYEVIGQDCSHGDGTTFRLRSTRREHGQVTLWIPGDEDLAETDAIRSRLGLGRMVFIGTLETTT